MPEGTKVKTVSEGVQTVQKGQVVALDHEGNPYVTTPANIVKRNEGLDSYAFGALQKVDQKGVETQLIKDFRAKTRKQFIEAMPKEYQKLAAEQFDKKIDTWCNYRDLTDYDADIVVPRGEYKLGNELGIIEHPANDHVVFRSAFDEFKYELNAIIYKQTGKFNELRDVKLPE